MLNQLALLVKLRRLPALATSLIILSAHER
jgi:hypothetical protein